MSAKDPRHDPLVIKRHCRCKRRHSLDRDERGMPTAMYIHMDSIDCPLHSPDPKFDLPKGVM